MQTATDYPQTLAPGQGEAIWFLGTVVSFWCEICPSLGEVGGS